MCGWRTGLQRTKRVGNSVTAVSAVFRVSAARALLHLGRSGLPRLRVLACRSPRVYVQCQETSNNWYCMMRYNCTEIIDGSVEAEGWVNCTSSPAAEAK